MENFSTEILDAICDEYADDKQLVVDMLRYLYTYTTDDRMKEQVVNILNDMKYCLNCGNKLTTYQYDEVHTELEHNNIEHLFIDLCPLCDMPNGKYKEVFE